MNHINKLQLAGVIFALSLTITTNTTIAESMSLESLLNGATITSGDKILSDFSYIPLGDMPAANQVIVTSITDNDGNFGFRFNGPFFDLGNDTQASDGFLEYTVNVLDPNMEIIGVELHGNPSVVGGDGIAQITDTFTTVEPNAQLEIFDVTPGMFVGVDSLTFGQGYTSLVVQKDILLSAEADAAATLSFFDQYFVQQQVPEPASAGLLAIGILGMLAQRKRRS